MSDKYLHKRDLAISNFIDKGESLYQIWKIQLCLTLTLYWVPTIISICHGELLFSLYKWLEKGLIVLILCLVSVSIIFFASLINAYRTWKAIGSTKEAIWCSMEHPNINKQIKKARRMLITIVACAGGMVFLFRIFKKLPNWDIQITYIVIGIVSLVHVTSTACKYKFVRAIKKIKRLCAEA
ncbi:hypothetical protein MHSWG343_08480 [Candidatus Mycoplasma haematohominis]|uniref:Uncharacterized protein n=1 Tax=Candidatus Mycoplasma haematohominis TaxID=1494318 RepID=A0A478FQQ4_9MOLU|nr:hypothetical protein MHSWG343_08480 [Candidatus Mycoplasma haemohominis]